MPFSVRRLGRALFLAVALVVPAMTVEAAPARKHTRTTIHRTTVRKTTTTRRHRVRRRVRRAPPVGGVYSRSAVVLDPYTGKVLYEKNAGSAVPIASLTKLMTALVFLDQNPDLSRSVEVTRDDLNGGGHTQLRNQEQVSLADLLHMSLMCSDNVATRVLSREAGLSHDDFIAGMNKKASELKLEHAAFFEQTGLDERNVATATDVARLLQAAADNDLIRSITTTRGYEFRSSRSIHRIPNTNRLLYGRYQVLGGKTGFINEAGYCLATWVRTDGRDMIAVVLGAPTNATRFADVVRLVQRTVKAGQTAQL